MNIFYKILKGFGITIIVCIISFFLLFKIVNHQKEALPNISTANQNQVDSILKIGFSKENLVPNYPIKIAGYGLKRQEFEGVNDSIFVRTLFFKNNFTKGVVITYDLLIVAPIIADKVTSELSKLGIENVFFSASHTHSSIGGYGENIVGKLALGGYNKVLVDEIVEKTIHSVIRSQNKLQKVSSITSDKRAFNKVKNRLNDERDVEQLFRSIYINTEDDKQIRLMSANVHPTIVSHSAVNLSNDYPGALCNKSKSTFNMFLAGTMGSLTPIIHKGKTGFDKAQNYANYLLESKIVDSGSITPNNLIFNRIALKKPKLGLSITESIQMRSWVFNLLFGDAKSYISTLKIGSLLMIGLPVELSGDYYEKLDQTAAEKGLKLFLTTFNGTYLGYAPPSEYFHINHRETRETNWLGKYGGDYFSEVIQIIIENQ